MPFLCLFTCVHVLYNSFEHQSQTIKSVSHEIIQHAKHCQHVVHEHLRSSKVLSPHQPSWLSWRRWVRRRVAVGNPRALTAQTPRRWMRMMSNFVQASTNTNRCKYECRN